MRTLTHPTSTKETTPGKLPSRMKVTARLVSKTHAPSMRRPCRRHRGGDARDESRRHAQTTEKTRHVSELPTREAVNRLRVCYKVSQYGTAGRGG